MGVDIDRFGRPVPNRRIIVADLDGPGESGSRDPGWRVYFENVRKLGCNRREWTLSRTLAIPPGGLIHKMAVEVDKALEGTNLGIYHFQSWVSCPQTPGPKSGIQGLLFGELTLYLASVVRGRGLVIQGDHAQVHAYGPDLSDIRLKTYGNNLLASKDTDDIWQAAERIDRIRLSGA